MGCQIGFFLSLVCCDIGPRCILLVSDNSMQQPPSESLETGPRSFQGEWKKSFARRARTRAEGVISGHQQPILGRWIQGREPESECGRMQKGASVAGEERKTGVQSTLITGDVKARKPESVGLYRPPAASPTLAEHPPIPVGPQPISRTRFTFANSSQTIYRISVALVSRTRHKTLTLHIVHFNRIECPMKNFH